MEAPCKAESGSIACKSNGNSANVAVPVVPGCSRMSSQGSFVGRLESSWVEAGCRIGNKRKVENFGEGDGIRETNVQRCGRSKANKCGPSVADKFNLSSSTIPFAHLLVTVHEVEDNFAVRMKDGMFGDGVCASKELGDVNETQSHWVIKVWSTEVSISNKLNPLPICVLDGHCEEIINTALCSTRPELLVSCCETTLILWNISSGCAIASESLNRCPKRVCFGKNGLLVLVMSRDGFVTTWNIIDHQLQMVHEFQIFGWKYFQPLQFCLNDCKLITAGIYFDGDCPSGVSAVKLCDVSDGKAVSEDSQLFLTSSIASGGSTPRPSFDGGALHPSGLLYAVASRNIDTVDVLDLLTHKIRFRFSFLNSAERLSVDELKCEELRTFLSFDGSGNRLVTGSNRTDGNDTGEISVWDFSFAEDTIKPVITFTVEAGIRGISVFNDGGHVAVNTVYDDVVIYCCQSGEKKLMIWTALKAVCSKPQVVLL